MSHHYNINVSLTPLVQGQKATISGETLKKTGLNMLVEIKTASIFTKQPGFNGLKNITVLGHFDTGASSTSIDKTVAEHLGLVPIGQTRSYTAAGPHQVPSYVIDLQFVGSNLKSFSDLKISSASLPFDIKNPIKPGSIGILIGRDVMSTWNITWNGPTSTVFISD